MSSYFTKWFRALSNGQASIVYGFLVVFVFLTLWHNPTKGYRRTFTWVETDSMELAVAKWKALEDDEDYNTSYIHLETVEFYWKYSSGVPEDGYSYPKRNPWWWIYGYQSKGFAPDTVPRFVRGPLLILETLGGYIQMVITVCLFAFGVIWLMGLRKASPE